MFKGTRANESIHVKVFYILIPNPFGKHNLIQLKLWLGLDWRTGNCSSTCYSRERFVLDSKENPERLIRMQKGTSVTNH